MCNNWILSECNAHVLIGEQNTHPRYHTCWHEWLRLQSSIHHHIMVYPEGDLTIHIWLFDIPVWKSVVWVFKSFYWWPRAPFSPAFHFGKITANVLKNGSCISTESVSAGSEELSVGKWTMLYDWPASLKCQCQLAVTVKQQENASC